MATDEGFKVTALIPEGGGPIALRDNTYALRALMCRRADIRSVGEHWARPGVYLLLADSGERGTFQAYVGKATVSLADRVREHVRSKDGWERAMLIARDTTDGFTSADVAWLEGRIWSLVHASERGTLLNAQQPGDDTLPLYDRAGLELLVAPITRLLRLIDVDVSPPSDDDGSAAGSGITRRRIAGSLEDLVDAGLLRDGQGLEFTWTGLERRAVIRARGKGRVVIELDGKEYASPSGAGGVIRGGAVNGWSYWATRDGEGNLVTLGELRSRLGE